MSKKNIYMDYAATTPVHPDVVERMLPFFSQVYGNPSGSYRLSQEAKKALGGARDTVADILGCESSEIVFTSGGTESDNAAIKGAASALRDRGNHIITSAIEHHAVHNTCHALEKSGFKVTYLPVDKYGMVDVDDLERAITGDTILVSIMLANNEIGTIQPVAEMARIIKSRKGQGEIVFHTDAVQCAGALELDTGKLGVDMLSLSAHKFQGPKGTGILYIKQGAPFIPQQTGGAQERGRRAGTENVAGIVGTAHDLSIAEDRREMSCTYCRKLCDRLIEGILSGIKDTSLNGHPAMRLPNNANITFKYIDGESILLDLDLAGVAASSGSSCASDSDEPSHVLTAIGLTAEMARSTLRFTLGPGNTEDDVDYVLGILPGIVERLRAMSPIASANGQ